MHTASDFPPELKAPCSVCIKLAVQLLSLEEEGAEEEGEVVFSFELGTQAPRITEGIVRSEQGRSGGKCPGSLSFALAESQAEKAVWQRLPSKAIESICYSAAEHSASEIVPRRLFCGCKRKEPFSPSRVACAAVFAEQPFRSFLLA